MSAVADTLAEIVQEIEAALAPQDVTVTTDPTEAAPAVAYGGTAVLVLPSPRIEFTTHRRRSYEWTVWALSGDADLTEAGARLLDVIDALAVVLLPTLATPQTYTLADREFAGYEITFTTETN